MPIQNHKTISFQYESSSLEDFKVALECILQVWEPQVWKTLSFATEDFGWGIMEDNRVQEQKSDFTPRFLIAEISLSDDSFSASDMVLALNRHIEENYSQQQFTKMFPVQGYVKQQADISGGYKITYKVELGIWRQTLYISLGYSRVGQ